MLVSAGDIAATELTAAAELLSTTRPELRLRYVHVRDLTCLGDPSTWPMGIPGHTFDEVFPPALPALVATTGHVAAIHALLGPRGQPRATVIRGWRRVATALDPEQLRQHAGLDATSLHDTALDLLKTAPQKDMP